MVVPNNLPPQLTTFIGREQEIADVRRLLASSRLLTLMGAGGSGKTRLSQKVATELAAGKEHADGIWFIDLAPLTDEELVPQMIASAVGVREEAGRPLVDTLIEHLRHRKVLLLLDNCEHLLEVCGVLLEKLLKACPHLHVLATSREALGIDGEMAWRVPSLSVPDPQKPVNPQDLSKYDSVRLFTERAFYSRMAFTITSANARAVAQLCYRLDGIPLAIELAAARVKVLSVEQIVDRLDERFRLLTGGSPTALPRQQTLQALMDWSYDLLKEEEKRLLRGLSVFVGSFALEAVQAICGTGVDEYEIINLLSHLVDKSLVLVEDQGQAARYRLLETIRQYAWDKLKESDEIDALRERHRDWYLTLGERAQTGLVGEEQRWWLEYLEMEHDNLRAALEWSVRNDHDPESALRLSGAVWRFWDMRGYITEGRRWLNEGLQAAREAHGSLDSGVWAKALSAAGNLAFEQADYDRAIEFHRQALELRKQAGDKRGTAGSLGNLGVALRHKGEYAEATRLYNESLAIFRELDNTQGISTMLNSLGFVAQCQEDYGRAEELYNEALALAQELGDKHGETIMLNNLGEVAQCQGHYEQAEEFYNQALALSHEIGDKVSIADITTNLGCLANSRGDSEAAIRLYRAGLQVCEELGHKMGIADCMEGIATAWAGKDKKRALRLFGAAEMLRKRTESPYAPYRDEDYRQAVARAKEGLTGREADNAWALGRTMTLEQALNWAKEDPALNTISVYLQTSPQHTNGVEKEIKPRQLDVLRLVATGMTDAEVAERLNIGVRTVQSHLQSVFRTLNVNSRSAATRYAIEHGLVTNGEASDEAS